MGTLTINTNAQQDARIVAAFGARMGLGRRCRHHRHAARPGMIRTLLLCLLLTACASANRKDTFAHGDLDRDGCIAYRCKAYCKDTATPEQIAAFMVGTTDEAEAAQLKRLRFWVVGDAASTISTLALCEAAREANPLLGASPHPFAVIAYSGIVYAVAKHDAARSPYWCSSARPLKFAASIRAAATFNNVAALAVCK